MPKKHLYNPAKGGENKQSKAQEAVEEVETNRWCSKIKLMILYLSLLGGGVVLRNVHEYITTLEKSYLESSETARHSHRKKIQDSREITFTNLGWFHPDKTIGLQTGRLISSSDYVEAIVAHPRYNASAWGQLEQHPDPTRPIIAFLDIETCGEINWPAMGGDIVGSSDRKDGRAPMTYYFDPDTCQKIDRVLRSPALSAPQSRLVVLNCFPGMPFKCLGRGPLHQQEPQQQAIANQSDIYDKMVVAHLSSHKTEAHPFRDMGLPPRPIKPIALDPQEQSDLQSCQDLQTRQYWFSFAGRPRSPFPQFNQYLEPLHGTSFPKGTNKSIHARFHVQHYLTSNLTQFNAAGNKVVTHLKDKQEQAKDQHYTLLRQSIFAACPRGDNLYSYRFAEVLSAGAIPVVYADGIVLPFLKPVVDWKQAAVLISQSDVRQTMDILSNLTTEQICTLKRNAYQVYQHYIQDSSAILRGILESLEARLHHDPLNFSFAPGDVIGLS